ncbi:MAG: ImmA/IrrE family metallo-endopeptidase [Acidimicrobiia bacterium]|nr:ImmA/IrrE family metallo-endopeptidase [Acidimicrobiia bacterium]
MNIINQLRAICPDRPLTDSEARSIAERQATQLLKLTSVDSPAVPSGIITELPRVAVDYTPGLASSGATMWTGGRWLIQLKAEDHPLRQRFSLAHELKHVIDHPYIDHLYQPDRYTSVAERAETICDYFAACLLMPRGWVKLAYGSGIQQPTELARLFGVSRQAILVRLTQLGLIEPAARCPGPLDPGDTPKVLRRYRRPAALAPAGAL